MLFLLADESLKSLNKIKSKYQADSGVEGRNFHMKGKNGEHLVINVPIGTLLKDENENIIHEMSHKKSKYIAARGGSGGKGNYYFMTNERRDPREFEAGHIGQEILLNIELKLIADAALVNTFSNALKVFIIQRSFFFNSTKRLAILMLESRLC